MKKNHKKNKCTCKSQQLNKHNMLSCLKNKFTNQMNNELFHFKQEHITLANIWKIKPISILMMFISAALFTLGINFFLGIVETIPTGLSAIPKLILILVYQKTGKNLEWLFSIIFLGLNIPLIIWLWLRSTNKSFVYLTIFWMIFQIFWNQIFSLDTSLKEFLKNNIIFTIPSGNKVNSGTLQTIYYTVIGGTLAGTAIGIAWKFGGSGGGTDLITYYITSKRRRPIGKFMFITSISFALFSLIMLYIIEPKAVNMQLLGLKTTAVFIYSTMSTLIVNRIYPKFGKILLKVYTNKPDEIVSHLKSINYWHSYNIWEGKSGYTGQKQWRVETVIFVIEKKVILEEIAKVDSQFWFSTQKIHDTTDRIDATKLN